MRSIGYAPAPSCCEKAAPGTVCDECAEISAGYQAAMRDPDAAPRPGEVSAALDRMDSLLDPAVGALSLPYTSATVEGSRRDMATIRAALAAPVQDVAPSDARDEKAAILAAARDRGFIFAKEADGRIRMIRSPHAVAQDAAQPAAQPADAQDAARLIEHAACLAVALREDDKDAAIESWRSLPQHLQDAISEHEEAIEAARTQGDAS